MKKIGMSVFSFLLLGAFAHAVQIDTALLDSAKPVTYIEDTSPVSLKDFNTGKQIRDMGRRLGSAIKLQEKSTTEPFASGAPSFKYSAKRVYHSEYRPGADILHIAKNATVGTTKCLYRIVSGYIEKAYNIPMEQADIIAEKVCWWNNNHFDDAKYFSSNFNPLVMDAFSDKTNVIGLATSYKDWAGKTRIVIPLIFVKETAPTASTPDKTQALENASVGNNGNSKNGVSDVASSGSGASASANESSGANASTGVNAVQENVSKNAEASASSNDVKNANSNAKNEIAGLEAKKQKLDMPINYKILFAILVLAALLLISLLIKVIKEILR